MLIELSTLTNKHNLKIRGIIHIGAHMMQEKALYDLGGIKNVIWLEGNPLIYERLKKKYPTVSGIYNVLISDKNDNHLKFHLANHSQSSSIFELNNIKHFYSKIKEDDTITLPSLRLSTFIKKEGINIKDYNFINLDIQGAELKALKGLGNYINSIQYIYTEVNLIELYKSCPILSEIDSYLGSKGFIRTDLELTNEGWGDAFYQRTLNHSDFTLDENILNAKQLEKYWKKKLLKKKLLYPIKWIKHKLFNEFVKN